MRGYVTELWDQAFSCSVKNGFSASIADIWCNFYSTCAGTMTLIEQVLRRHVIAPQSQYAQEHTILIVDDRAPLAIPKIQEETTPWEGKLFDATPVLLTRLPHQEILLRVGAEVNILSDGPGGHTLCQITDSAVSDRIARRPHPYGYFLLLLNLVLTAHRKYMLHASAVASQGRALIMLGPSGAGKTTMSLALARSGMDFMGDDLIAVAKQEETVTAYGLLLDPKVELVPGQGKESVDYIASENLGVCLTADMEGVITLQRNPAAPPELRSVSRAQILHYLLTQSTDCRTMWFPQDWFETAAAIADAVPGWRWNPPPLHEINLSSVTKIIDMIGNNSFSRRSRPYSPPGRG